MGWRGGGGRGRNREQYQGGRFCCSRIVGSRKVTGMQNTGGIQLGGNNSFLLEKECMYEKIVPTEEIHVRGCLYVGGMHMREYVPMEWNAI
jgi:hypothetical protein